MSKKIAIKGGAPQGSVLRLLFYLLYIHNMEKIRLRSNYTVNADDTDLRPRYCPEAPTTKSF